jgi:hypothetical protein
MQPLDDFQAAPVADTPLAQWATQPFTLWMQGCARLQAESIRFAADRFAKDLRVPGRLGACATPVEMFGVAAGIAIEAARDYLGESQRLLALAAGDFESATATML